MEEKLIELIKKRYSCRKFKKESVIEKEILIKCIEAARFAPSASNSQPWKYVIVDEKELKSRIVDALTIGFTKFNQFAKDASAIIVAIEESKNLEMSIGQVVLGKSFATFDIGCSVMQLCLQASEFGLGTCIMGIFDEKKIKKLLNIPSNKKITILIAIGYPQDNPTEKKRKVIDDIYSFNRYK